MQESFSIWRRQYRNWLKNYRDGFYLVERVPKDWKSYSFKYFSQQELSGVPTALIWAVAIKLSNMAKALDNITIDKLGEYAEGDEGISEVFDLMKLVNQKCEEDDFNGLGMEEKIRLTIKQANLALCKAELQEVEIRLKHLNLAQVVYRVFKEWIPIILQGKDLNFEIGLIAHNTCLSNINEIYKIILTALGHLEAFSTTGIEFIESFHEHSQNFDGENENDDENIENSSRNNVRYILSLKDALDFARYTTGFGLRFKLEELAFQLQAYCRTNFPICRKPSEEAEMSSNFIPCVQIAGIIRRRSDAIARTLRTAKYTVVKKAGKNYCDPEQAAVLFPKWKKHWKARKEDE